MALAGASQITVINRTREQGKSPADLLNSKTSVAASLEVWVSTYRVDPGIDIVINAITFGRSVS